MRLHLGVYDLPYTGWAPGKKNAKPKRSNARPKKAPRTAAARAVSTGQVAEWLENRYHIMEVFFEADGGVADLLEESVQNAIESILMGAPLRGSPFAEGTSEIQARFKTFLSSREIERMGIPGVPTKAALMGTSARFKRGRNRQGRRPSFIDTGLYQSSFVAWVE